MKTEFRIYEKEDMFFYCNANMSEWKEVLDIHGTILETCEITRSMYYTTFEFYNAPVFMVPREDSIYVVLKPKEYDAGENFIIAIITRGDRLNSIIRFRSPNRELQDLVIDFLEEIANKYIESTKFSTNYSPADLQRDKYFVDLMKSSMEEDVWPTSGLYG